MGIGFRFPAPVSSRCQGKLGDPALVQYAGCRSGDQFNVRVFTAVGHGLDLPLPAGSVVPHIFYSSVGFKGHVRRVLLAQTEAYVVGILVSPADKVNVPPVCSLFLQLQQPGASLKNEHRYQKQHHANHPSLIIQELWQQFLHGEVNLIDSNSLSLP